MKNGLMCSNRSGLKRSNLAHEQRKMNHEESTKGNQHKKTYKTWYKFNPRKIGK
jgi:hypothetical protein